MKCARMTDCARMMGRTLVELRRERCALPANAGLTAIGDVPTPERLLVSEELLGLARVRAEARQGCSLEQFRGGEHACHRKSMVTESGA
jgi:hypothetical protein